jgi:hypothetical protein
VRGTLEGASGSRRRSPTAHRRCAAPPCQWCRSTPDERAHAGGDHRPRINGGSRDGLLANRDQNVTNRGSRLPSRARASTFGVGDQWGYGDNRTDAAHETRSRIWPAQSSVRPDLSRRALRSRAHRVSDRGPRRRAYSGRRRSATVLRVPLLRRLPARTAGPPRTTRTGPGASRPIPRTLRPVTPRGGIDAP